MTEQTYSDSELDHYRHSFRDAARGKGTTHVPVKDGQAGKVADMLDDLAERKRTEMRSFEFFPSFTLDAIAALSRPCRACGTRGATQGGYCGEHA